MCFVSVVDWQRAKEPEECSSQFQLNNAISVKLNIFTAMAFSFAIKFQS